MYLDQPKKIFAQKLYDQSATPLERLGSLWFLDDGRVFMYARAGAADTVAANVLQGPVPEAQHLNIVVAATAAIGDTKVKVTLGTTAAAANLYRDGYMHTNDATGEGYVYRVNYHPAIALSTAGWFYLHDPLQIGLTISVSEVTFTKHPADGVIQMVATNPTGMVIGVAPTVITALYYGWIQVRGPAAVLCAGTVVVGDDVVPSGTGGAVMPSAASNATLHSRIGRVIQVNASTEQALVWLTII